MYKRFDLAPAKWISFIQTIRALKVPLISPINRYKHYFPIPLWFGLRSRFRIQLHFANASPIADINIDARIESRGSLASTWVSRPLEFWGENFYWEHRALSCADAHRTRETAIYSGRPAWKPQVHFRTNALSLGGPGRHRIRAHLGWAQVSKSKCFNIPVGLVEWFQIQVFNGGSRRPLQLAVWTIRECKWKTGRLGCRCVSHTCLRSYRLRPIQLPRRRNSIYSWATTESSIEIK